MGSKKGPNPKVGGLHSQKNLKRRKACRERKEEIVRITEKARVRWIRVRGKRVRVMLTKCPKPEHATSLHGTDVRAPWRG